MSVYNRGAPQMTELLLCNISKKYGETQVLDGINLRISDGEFCIVIGPSGSGKTTLLNIIAGFVKPDEGEVYIDGRVVNHLSPQDRNIGMIFQEFGLFSHMTVKSNISFGLEIKRYNRKEIDGRVIDMAKKLRIEHLLNKKPSILSGGEAQRVAIARTLVTEPSLFLFDEPLGNLDANLRMELLTEIKRLHLSLGKTFVYVTHDQEQALSVADRVVIMKDGRIIQEGHPREVYESPVNRFVAEFFGVQSMNLIEGVVVLEQNEAFFKSNGLVIKLREPTLQLIEERKVMLGIRPQDVILGNQVIKPNGVGSVSLIEFLGEMCRVYVTLGDQQLVSIIPPKLRPCLGDEVGVELKEDKIFIFSDEGERIYP